MNFFPQTYCSKQNPREGKGEYEETRAESWAIVALSECSLRWFAHGLVGAQRVGENSIDGLDVRCR